MTRKVVISMWFLDSFYKYAVAVILVLTIILLVYHTAPVFYPVLWFITAILLPILFATLLYYLLRPLVDFLERKKIERHWAILLVYLSTILAGALLFFAVIPQIAEQIGEISSISPEQIESIKTNTQDVIEELKSYFSAEQLPAIENVLYNYLQKVNSFLYQLLYNTITTLASIAIALALTPFVLFYFLRDARLFQKFILDLLPDQFHEEVHKTLDDIDSTLSSFIIAQMTVALIVGCFLFFGYLVIGLPQAMALALFGMIFYVIPILGTFVAIIPALLVAFTINSVMALKVVLVMFLAHFIEANLLTPRLMSQRLKIHPLTVILLLLAAGSLYGLLGLLLVTPTYAILKVIVSNVYKISRLRYDKAQDKDHPSIETY